MALGYVKRPTQELVVFTFPKELGYGTPKSGNWWAQRALIAIADNEERLPPGTVTRWTFPDALQIAVERIIKSRGRQLSVLESRWDCLLVLQIAERENWLDDHYSSTA